MEKPDRQAVSWFGTQLVIPMFPPRSIGRIGKCFRAHVVVCAGGRGAFLHVHPLQSPRLRGIRVEAKPTCPKDWNGLAPRPGGHLEEIVLVSRTQPLDHARLKQLREKYKLA